MTKYYLQAISLIINWQQRGLILKLFPVSFQWRTNTWKKQS